MLKRKAPDQKTNLKSKVPKLSRPPTQKPGTLDPDSICRIVSFNVDSIYEYDAMFTILQSLYMNDENRILACLSSILADRGIERPNTITQARRLIMNYLKDQRLVYFDVIDMKLSDLQEMKALGATKADFENDLVLSIIINAVEEDSKAIFRMLKNEFLFTPEEMVDIFEQKTIDFWKYMKLSPEKQKSLVEVFEEPLRGIEDRFL